MKEMKTIKRGRAGQGEARLNKIQRRGF